MQALLIILWLWAKTHFPLSLDLWQPVGKSHGAETNDRPLPMHR